MSKLSKKESRKLLAGLGAAATLGGVGVAAAVNANNLNPQPARADEASAEGTVKYVSDAIFKKGSDINFDIYYQVPYNINLKKLVLYDKLEPVFTHEKTRVYDGDKDVTDQFTADFDKANNQTSMTAKKPEDWVGKKLSIRVSVNLQKNANLGKYLDKNTNQYNIPNVGHMRYNDEHVETPPVYVHTPNDEDPTAIKQVEDKNKQFGDSAKQDPGDEFHYRVQYFIPENGKDITNVNFFDNLEKVLDLENVKITDDQGNDITSNEGDLKLDKDKESFDWQPKKEYLTKMPGHTYTAEITAKLKTDGDLSPYFDKAKKLYLVPNTAHMKYNNKDIPSNPVTVETPPPAENKVVKSVTGLSGSAHEDKDNVEIGKDYTYTIKFTPGEGQNLQDVEFLDDLEDVLNLEKVVVSNPEGKDVTSEEGTLKVDDKAESFVWQPKEDVVKKMGGKTYSVAVTAKVKADADLQKYLKNNTIEIPNTAEMRANGKKTPSNTPVVTPKTEEPKAKKGIVKDPSNWSQYFGIKSSTDTGQGKNNESSDSKSVEPAAYQDAHKYAKFDADSGKWSKTSKDVTDEQFNKAVETLKKPVKTEAVDTSKQNASTVSTHAPSGSGDLKNIIGTTTITNNTARRGDALDYLLTFDIGNSNDMKSLVISDDLEQVLDLKNVVIIDEDGNNITNDGQLVTSDQDESFTWTAKDPTKYSGKKLYAAVASNIKANADVSNYDGQQIPNTGHLIINGKDTPTNVVNTKLPGDPKPDKEKPNKNDPKDPDKAKKNNEHVPDPDKKNPNNPNNPGGSNNPLTGKNGVLPQTGHFIMQNAGWFIAALVGMAGAVGAYIYKKNPALQAKVKGFFKGKK